MLCSPCKEQWTLHLVSFHHKLIMEPLTQFKVLPQNDSFVNGWESYPEILQSNYWNLGTVCSLDVIIKMHWPSWQSCWCSKMGRKQAELQHCSAAGQFLCQMYFLYCSKVVQGNRFFFNCFRHASVHHLNFSWYYCTVLGGIWHLFICVLRACFSELLIEEFSISLLFRAGLFV